MPLEHEEILHRFGFHKATIEGQNATAPKHADLREEFIKFASHLNDVLPDGRYKDIVLEELEDVSMWAHKSIARTASLEMELLLVCEYASLDGECKGPVRRWFIPPDDKNAHQLCDFHKSHTWNQSSENDPIDFGTHVCDETCKDRPVR